MFEIGVLALTPPSSKACIRRTAEAYATESSAEERFARTNAGIFRTQMVGGRVCHSMAAETREDGSLASSLQFYLIFPGWFAESAYLLSQSETQVHQNG